MNGAPETRQSLLVRLLDRQNQQAWDEFASIYEPLVYRLARRQGFQHADALDLTQDVLGTVSHAIERFDPDPSKGSFRAWLNRIARNLIINALTRGRDVLGTGETAVHDLLHSTPVEDTAASRLFELEYQRELFRCAADRVREQFSADTWRAFWLTAVEGLPNDQAAGRLGKTPGAVRIARCRVLAKLRTEVQRLEETN